MIFVFNQFQADLGFALMVSSMNSLGYPMAFQLLPMDGHLAFAY
jgi:hypothetical protein